MNQPPWYCIDNDTALAQLGSTSAGLSETEAKLRLSAQGPNTLPVTRQYSIALVFLRQFSDFMILVLLAAALVSAIIGSPKDALVILVIVLLNAIIGAVQEYRAERAVAALRQMATPDTLVMRDGTPATLSATDLVRGDIVLLEAGNIIPADLRILESIDLQVDESALSGESIPVNKQSAKLVAQDLALSGQSNIGFSGSLVSRGRGTGVVIATGSNTEIGRIAGMLATKKSVKTPLQIRLTRFGRNLSLAILAICTVIFFAGLLQGQALLLMFLTAVSLAVAAIPEALPAVVTISLALGARNLSLRQALVRNLPAVETLGSVTYICTDKTGTLTLNQMRAEYFSSLAKSTHALIAESSQEWQEFATAMALNNDIHLADNRATGEATELALYEAARLAGYDKPDLEAKFPRLCTLAFDSQRKRMTTLHQLSDGVVAYIKGAPEQVLPLCIDALSDSRQIAFNAEAVLQQADDLANKGYRVLALAKREIPQIPDTPSPSEIEHALTFIGLVGLIDPPRPEAAQAVAECLTAGITPVMITGDHPGTARTIAVRLGIAGNGARIITGSELNQMSDNAFSECVGDVPIYARVSPEQKLRIVRALQAKGEFVAMTGDGINDAPALKHAGIGVAMGKKGTDVAREAADIILMDDNFATIVSTVRSGRRIFDNIRKFIKDTMSSNSGEIWTLFLAPLLGLPIPLLPVHILWINLVTDGLPGLAFAAEPADSDIMQRPPRPPDEDIFQHGMWQHIVWVGLFVGGITISAQAWSLSRDVSYWQTVTFTVLTLSQLFHSLAVRSERESLFTIGLGSNLPMLGAVVLTMVLQLLVIYTPFLNEIFHTQPLPLFDLLICFALSTLVLIAVELEKLLVRRGVIKF